MSAQSYLLKVLSGPHQGAELALAEGELLIGSGSECDLILSDALINPEHAKIIVGADGSLLLIPIAPPVYVGGQEVSIGGTQPLEVFQFVSLGTTHFVVGPVEGEWPPLSLADVPELKKLEQPVEVIEEESEPSEESKESDDLEKEEAEPEVLWQNPVMLGASFLVILILVTMSMLFLTKENVMEPAEVQETRKDKIELALKDTGLMRYLTLEEAKPGALQVEGWLQDNEEKERIEAVLSPYMEFVDMRIYSQEQILASVRDVLAILKLPLTVHSMEFGKIRIEGYFGDAAEWAKIREEIESDIPGITYLKDDVYTTERIYPEIVKSLMDSGLSDKIEVHPSKGFILLKGMISKEEIPALKEAMVNFQSQMGFSVPVQNQIVVEEADKIYLDAQIDSVIIGDVGVIITKNGQRLFKGGVLRGGYTIKAITRDGISLQKGEQQITLKIGEE